MWGLNMQLEGLCQNCRTLLKKKQFIQEGAKYHEKSEQILGTIDLEAVKE